MLSCAHPGIPGLSCSTNTTFVSAHYWRSARIRSSTSWMTPPCRHPDVATWLPGTIWSRPISNPSAWALASPAMPSLNGNTPKPVWKRGRTGNTSCTFTLASVCYGGPVWVLPVVTAIRCLGWWTDCRGIICSERCNLHCQSGQQQSESGYEQVE